ncbi:MULTISPECIES: dihydrofolate reductase [unclassified Actinobaculum]|uniref:dihydrofolate reductase n=1 Tax=unclassified Actinobaculum TaxID=2609299 RepID=UPI000D52A4EF|nr:MULTISPECIES: dihydrofolate reductase [unclassified Actinobaculum]AWE42831.1 dihydrofolate reductase [Actinobaculum sp. 313]RTE47856.1 dihydrofolate reductase [Actinobaculum sp. 352]
MLALIWAQARDGAIGAAGTIPWHVPEDMALFRRMTKGHPVIMGRRTWESLAQPYRPLPGRQNIVISSSVGFRAPGAAVTHSLAEAFELAATTGSDLTWIMGGAQLYAAGLPHAEILVVTELDISVPEADAFAPPIGPRWRLHRVDPPRGWLTSRSANGIHYRFCVYRRDDVERAAVDAVLPRLVG